MIKTAFHFVVLLSMLAACAGSERNPCPAGFHTLYSQKATTLDAGTLALKSPDGRKTLLAVVDRNGADDGQVNYTIRVGGQTFTRSLLGFNAEVSWSPDSNAFVVTETEGGGGIGYRVYVFYVDRSGIDHPGGAERLDEALKVHRGTSLAPGSWHGLATDTSHDRR